MPNFAAYLKGMHVCVKFTDGCYGTLRSIENESGGRLHCCKRKRFVRSEEHERSTFYLSLSQVISLTLHHKSSVLGVAAKTVTA